MADSSQLLLPIKKILSAATAADSTGIGVVPESMQGLPVEYTFYFVFSSAAAAGTVLVETAHDSNYAGTWETIGTQAWAAGGKVETISITALLQAVRVRISSAITSGTVDVWVIAGARS